MRERTNDQSRRKVLFRKIGCLPHGQDFWPKILSDKLERECLGKEDVSYLGVDKPFDERGGTRLIFCFRKKPYSLDEPVDAQITFTDL